MKHSLINLALFIGVLACMVGIQALPDHGPEQTTAREELDRQRQQERFERAAQQMCGDQAAWARIDSTTVQCFTHKGAKAGRASL